MAGKYKAYKGYIIAPGIRMPSYDIYEYEIFENLGQYEEHSPVHTAESEGEAERWVDGQSIPVLPADAEDLKKVIEAMPFMPEKGPPLPEYVTAELYPSPTWDTMKAPVSDYGKVVVDETARLLMEFVLGGHFERRTKFEETGWSSEDIMYTGELLHTATGVVYLTGIGVSFAWRDPTKDVTRNITLFEEKPDGPEDIWEGDLSYEGGQTADNALRGQQ